MGAVKMEFKSVGHAVNWSLMELSRHGGGVAQYDKTPGGSGYGQMSRIETHAQARQVIEWLMQLPVGAYMTLMGKYGADIPNGFGDAVLELAAQVRHRCGTMRQRCVRSTGQMG